MIELRCKLEAIICGHINYGVHLMHRTVWFRLDRTSRRTFYRPADSGFYPAPFVAIPWQKVRDFTILLVRLPAPLRQGW